MSLVGWETREPLREMAELQRSIGRLFDSAHLDGGAVRGFPVDVYETADDVVVRADLPGVQPDDVQVQYHGGQLSIRASRRAAAPEGASWRHQETRGGEFLRSFHLGVPVNDTAIQAEHQDGVLTIRLPKAEEARPKQIQVRRVGPGR